MLTAIRNIHRNYFDSFKNLPKEVWWLAFVTFINRAGTMIIPFLSLYLSEDLSLSLSNVGWVMVSFGAGSVLGSWLGGKLTDKFGFYKVMTLSLLLTGILFILLQWIRDFYALLFAIFIVMSIADTFRPATFVAIKHYSSEENQTRSVTLIRLAINLGFSMGPALGGIIITFWGYTGLFWVDGITCVMAYFIFIAAIKEIKKVVKTEGEEIEEPKVNVLKDKKFLLFIFVTFLMGFVFMQVFSTVPIFYRDVFNLDEAQIGLLLAMNGLLIFFTEMPIVHELEKRNISRIKIVRYSLILIAFSFVVFNFGTSGIWILILNMLMITIGEMLGFPFTNAIAMRSSPKGAEGSYMAYYTISFSMAHLLSAKIGLFWIDKFGFESTWYLMGVIGLIALAISFRIKD